MNDYSSKWILDLSVNFITEWLDFHALPIVAVQQLISGLNKFRPCFLSPKSFKFIYGIKVQVFFLLFASLAQLFYNQTHLLKKKSFQLNVLF